MAHQFFFNPYILDNLNAPSRGFDVVQDISEPRLRLYITSRGVKTFFVRKRINGRDRRILIGKYPDMDIEEARSAVANVLDDASKKVSNVSGSKLNMIRAVTNTYPTANAQTTIKLSFCFLKTLIMILMFFEYLNALKTRNTRSVRSNLATFRTLKPLLSNEMLGRIETKSIIAIKVKGYLKNEDAPLLSL